MHLNPFEVEITIILLMYQSGNLITQLEQKVITFIMD